MNTIRLLTLGAALALALPAAASDKTPIYTRQVAHCMLARMKANRSESYREALKVCKQSADPASRDPVGATAMNTVNGSEPAKP